MSPGSGRHARVRRTPREPAGALDPLLRAARGRRAAIAFTAVLPWTLVPAALAWRYGDGLATACVLVVTVFLVALVALQQARRLDLGWLQRRLDATHPGLEDSTGLLAVDVAALSPLQRLQRARVLQRLPTPDAAGVRAPWPVRRLMAAGVVAVALAVAILAWPVMPTAAPDPGPRIGAPSGATPDGPLRLAASSLRIAPPAYTGLPQREERTLDARVPEGARLAWTLRFDGGPEPDAVSIDFLDGRRVELASGEDRTTWVGEATADASGLYRIGVVSAQPWQDPALHRIDVTPDRPPTLRVTAPTQTLSLRADGQRTWELVFEATDDHGLAAVADLHLTMTEGSGENIGLREEARQLAGRGAPRSKRFSHRLDLDALGMSQGDDLIVHFVVRDQRPGGAQATRSASHILRWPPPEARAADGFDGVLQRVLPAYFASQRQIIIDAEALIAERPRLAADAFADRSDAIAVDQRLLRLRYGQFLGEESEPGPTLPGGTTHDEDLPPPPMLLPTNDAEDEADAWREMVQAARDGDDAGHDHAHGPSEDEGDGPAGFGVAGDVLEEFGHTHDIPEAATLLDPRTRDLLRRALGEMWQSELALRQARPDDALPPANRALALVKEIQQADRIYLSRTGTALPPIDFDRRLGGDRAGIADRRIPPAAATDAGDVPAGLWRALADDGDGDTFDSAPLHAWLAAHQAAVEDPLALLAALDRVERDPGCAACRQRLRALLWPLATPPPATPRLRSAPDATGRAYLDALQAEDGE